MTKFRHIGNATVSVAYVEDAGEVFVLTRTPAEGMLPRLSVNQSILPHFMKCPYCVEEIKDGAIVCRFCAKDLQIPSLVSARLSTIENDIGELRALLQAAVAHKPRTETESQKELTLGQ